MPKWADHLCRSNGWFCVSRNIQLPRCHGTKPHSCHNTQDITQERQHQLKLQHFQKSIIVITVWCAMCTCACVCVWLCVCVSLLLYTHSILHIHTGQCEWWTCWQMLHFWIHVMLEACVSGRKTADLTLLEWIHRTKWQKCSCLHTSVRSDLRGMYWTVYQIQITSCSKYSPLCSTQ